MNWVKRQHKEPNEFLCELSDDEDINGVLPTEKPGKNNPTECDSIRLPHIQFFTFLKQYKPFDCKETRTNS